MAGVPMRKPGRSKAALGCARHARHARHTRHVVVISRAQARAHAARWRQRKDSMQIEVTPLGDECNVVRLAGRLDADGVDRVESRFTAAAVASNKHALVDFSQVDFVASMGIRMLITVARGMSNRNRRIAIYAPNQVVGYVLESVALGELIPIASDQDQALRAISG
jgi:anti-anti-sigma factor